MKNSQFQVCNEGDTWKQTNTPHLHRDAWSIRIRFYKEQSLERSENGISHTSSPLHKNDKGCYENQSVQVRKLHRGLLGYLHTIKHLTGDPEGACASL